MSADPNDRFYNVVIVLVVGGLILGGVFYVLFLFWPYLMFYVLPFVVGSLVTGGILRVMTSPGREDGELFVHRRLAVAYPVLVLIVAVIFFANPKRSIVVDKKGKQTATVLDWMEAHKTFNEWRASTYANAPFDSLKKKAREVEIYDRQEIGWIALWCLILGGPVFFWYLSRDDHEKDSEVIEAMANARTGDKRRFLDEKSDQLNEIIANHATVLKKKIAGLEAEQDTLLDENRILKAKVEFSPGIPKPPETQKTGGVLDQDIF